MKKNMNSLRDLFEHSVQDLFSAEDQLIKALPKMAENASDEEVKELFRIHLEETKKQKERLEKIAKMLDFNPKGEKCHGMEGLIEEGEEIMKLKGNAVKDAGLIAAGQKVEHYEIAGYGTARRYAEKLGEKEAVKLLEQTLNEEKEADTKLNKAAVNKVNIEALKEEE